jgi:hypothetical protein
MRRRLCPEWGFPNQKNRIWSVSARLLLGRTPRTTDASNESRPLLRGTFDFWSPRRRPSPQKQFELLQTLLHTRTNMAESKLKMSGHVATDRIKIVLIPPARGVWIISCEHFWQYATSKTVASVSRRHCLETHGSDVSVE